MALFLCCLKCHRGGLVTSSSSVTSPSVRRHHQQHTTHHQTGLSIYSLCRGDTPHNLHTKRSSPSVTTTRMYNVLILFHPHVTPPLLLVTVSRSEILIQHPLGLKIWLVNWVWAREGDNPIVPEYLDNDFCVLNSRNQKWHKCGIFKPPPTALSSPFATLHSDGCFCWLTHEIVLKCVCYAIQNSLANGTWISADKLWSSMINRRNVSEK